MLVLVLSEMGKFINCDLEINQNQKPASKWLDNYFDS